jgi:hypothetical protein
LLLSLSISPEAFDKLGGLAEAPGKSWDEVISKASALYVEAADANQKGKAVGIAPTADVLETQFVGFCGGLDMASPAKRDLNELADHPDYNVKVQMERRATESDAQHRRRHAAARTPTTPRPSRAKLDGSGTLRVRISVLEARSAPVELL